MEKTDLHWVHELKQYSVIPLWFIGMDCFISEPCYKGTLLQRNYMKMTFVKFHDKKFGCHKNTRLYPNLCYDEVCCKLFYQLPCILTALLHVA